MINVIQTLKNLNKEFPRYQLETLLKIVECIQEDYPAPDWSKTITWKDYPVYVSNTPPEAFMYNTTTKNHASDKTSCKQTITSAGEEADNSDVSFMSIIRNLNDIDEALRANRVICD